MSLENWYLNPLSPPLIGIALVCLGLGGYLWRKRATPGSGYLAAILVCMALWTLLHGLELMSGQVRAAVALAALQHPFIQSVPPLWLLYTLSFFRQQTLPLRWWTALLWLVPAGVVGLVLTNNYHHLYWTGVTLEETASGPLAVYTHGPAVVGVAGYAYGLLLLGAGTLLAAGLRGSPSVRRQTAVLLSAAAVPLAANLIFLSFTPFRGPDLTPLSFAFTGFLLVWSTSRFGLGNLVPVAYDRLFANLADAVLVLDAGRRITGFNPAAQSLFCLPEDPPVLPLESLLPDSPEVLALMAGRAVEPVEVKLRLERQSGWFSVSLSEMNDSRGENMGWLVLFKDIQERKSAEERTRQDAASLELLNEITEAALAAPNLAAMLQGVADRLGELIQADECFITLWDEEYGMTVPVAASGEYQASFPLHFFPPGERTLTYSVLEKQATLIIEDSKNSPYLNPALLPSYPPVAMVAIPLMAGDEWLGAVAFTFYKGRAFSPEEIRRAEGGARQVSLAISKMRLLERANQRTAQLAMLNRIGVTLTSGLDFSSVIRAIFEQCRLALEMDVFYLALYDERSGMADFPILYQDEAYQSQESLDVGTSGGLVSHVIRTRSSLLVADLMNPRERLPFSVLRTGRRPARSVLAAPLLLEDRVVGMISGQSYRGYAYRQEDLHLLETLAAQAVVALENARLYGEVRRLSTIDELTGLYNYRSLLELGAREVDRARRFGRPLSVLFFDVDHFRRFNNRYSHATGNVVLRSLAGIVLDNLRGVDLLFRYGGEEFVALLPETGLATAAGVAERLRGAVEAMKIPSEWGELGVTISLGVASLTDEMADLEALLASADLAEKRAKELGRNRVVVSEQTQTG